MTNAEQLGEFLKDDAPWNEAEKWVIKWQFHQLGHFQTALADAITRADDINLVKLSLGFPDQVHGFIAWNRGDLGDRLRAAGLEI